MAKKMKKGRGTVSESTPADKARSLKTRVDESGKNTRLKGHVSARTRRNQAKRDQKNS